MTLELNIADQQPLNTNTINEAGTQSSTTGPNAPAVDDVNAFNQAMDESTESVDDTENEGEMTDEQYDALLKSVMMNTWVILAIAGP